MKKTKHNGPDIATRLARLEIELFGHTPDKRLAEKLPRNIWNDPSGWPRWCPNCLNRHPEHPASNWEAQQDGLECRGCGCLQRWSTIEEYRSWLAEQKKKHGSGFEAWLDGRFDADEEAFAEQDERLAKERLGPDPDDLGDAPPRRRASKLGMTIQERLNKLRERTGPAQDSEQDPDDEPNLPDTRLERLEQLVCYLANYMWHIQPPEDCDYTGGVKSYLKLVIAGEATPEAVQKRLNYIAEHRRKAKAGG